MKMQTGLYYWLTRTLRESSSMSEKSMSRSRLHSMASLSRNRFIASESRNSRVSRRMLGFTDKLLVQEKGDFFLWIFRIKS